MKFHNHSWFICIYDGFNFVDAVKIAAFDGASSLGLIYKNNRGVRSFKKRKKLEAYEEFVHLLGESPYDPLLQFNVGSSLSGVGEEEKSATLYKQLLKDVDGLLSQNHRKRRAAEIIKNQIRDSLQFGSALPNGARI